MELSGSNTKKFLIFSYISGNKKKKIIFQEYRNPERSLYFRKSNFLAPKKLNKIFLKFLAQKNLIKLHQKKLDA